MGEPAAPISNVRHETLERLGNNDDDEDDDDERRGRLSMPTSSARRRSLSMPPPQLQRLETAENEDENDDDDKHKDHGEANGNDDDDAGHLRVPRAHGAGGARRRSRSAVRFSPEPPTIHFYEPADDGVNRLEKRKGPAIALPWHDTAT